MLRNYRCMKLPSSVNWYHKAVSCPNKGQEPCLSTTRLVPLQSNSLSVHLTNNSLQIALRLTSCFPLYVNFCSFVKLCSMHGTLLLWLTIYVKHRCLMANWTDILINWYESNIKTDKHSQSIIIYKPFQQIMKAFTRGIISGLIFSTFNICSQHLCEVWLLPVTNLIIKALATDKIIKILFDNQD